MEQIYTLLQTYFINTFYVKILMYLITHLCLYMCFIDVQ